MSPLLPTPVDFCLSFSVVCNDILMFTFGGVFLLICFACIYSAWCFLGFLDLWVCVWHSFGRNSQPLLFQIFLAPFSLFGILCIFDTFYCYPKVLRYSVLFFLFFILFAFLFGMFLLIYPHIHRFFLNHVQTAILPIKGIFPFYYSAMMSNISFLSFLRIPILCLHFPFVLMCCLLHLVEPPGY